MINIRSVNSSSSKVNTGKTENTRKKASAQTASSTTSDSSDSIELTGQTAKIAQLIQQMKSSPVVDANRIAPIKEKLTNGKYNIDHQQVANKMLDFETSYSAY